MGVGVSVKVNFYWETIALVYVLVVGVHICAWTLDIKQSSTGSVI